VNLTPKSTFVISLTAFTRTGELDEAGMREHFRRLGDARIGVYVAGSGSGEAHTLSPAERDEVLRVAAEELKGHTQVRAMGVEPRTAREMVAFGAAVEQAGLDAMQIYPLDVGHGVVPTPLEIERYLDEVLSNVNIPAVVATHQYAGYLVPIDVLTDVIARHPHVIGINCTVAAGDFGYLTRIIDTFAADIEVHVGGPTYALLALALGGSGYLCSEGNLAPRLCASVTDHFNAGDHTAALAAYAKVMRLYAANRYGSIRGIKAALDMLGLPGGHPRLPRLPLGSAELSEVRAMLETLALEELPHSPTGDEPQLCA
jgi:4-hydroxy-tetrahydrodipicolinate synthase